MGLEPITPKNAKEVSFIFNESKNSWAFLLIICPL